MKKLFCTFAAAVMLIMGLSVTAAAASCTCGVGGMPHDSSHTQIYELANDLGMVTATQHQGICWTCVDQKGHTADAQTGEVCEQVKWSWQDHQFEIEGEGTSRKKVCSVCGYTEDAPCTHENTVWEKYDQCIQKCKDCGITLDTRAHSYKAYKLENGVTADENHGMRCVRCGITTFDKPHNYKTAYKAYTGKKSPISDIADNKCATLYHAVVQTCKDCGYENEISGFDNPKIKHVFKNDKCKYCGYKRTILPKVKSLKVSKAGKLFETTHKVAAHWEWVGNKLYWRKAYTYKTNGFKVSVKWKKVANAYGYVISTDKLKAGDYVNKVGKGYSHTVTRKTSYNYCANIIDQSVRSVAIYVAPLSKDGFIGKVAKITVKVR